MTESLQQQERRSEVRKGAPATRLSWAHDGETGTTAGWVSDVAKSSISFVTPTRNLPAPGEMIELTLNAGSPLSRNKSVLVARTAPYDSLFSVVACRTGPTL